VLVEFAVLLLTYLPSIVAVLVFSYHKESALFVLDYPLSSSLCWLILLTDLTTNVNGLYKKRRVGDWEIKESFAVWILV
jgi:hypothetical protein